MNKQKKVLTRTKHGVLSGTLAGFAEHFEISKSKLRFVFLVLGLFGIGLVFYFVLWLCIPSYNQRALLLAEQDDV